MKTKDYEKYHSGNHFFKTCQKNGTNQCTLLHNKPAISKGLHFKGRFQEYLEIIFLTLFKTSLSCDFRYTIYT